MNKQPVFPDEPQIPILPNMLTAGNLLCGFFAILIIFEGMGFTPGSSEAFACFQKATYLIFAACIFDLLDGRVARMCGSDGPFGREFDSIADVVSFGIAPAMLLSKAVLFGLPQPWTWMGWGVAVLYLLCAALRLARFNCMAAAPRKENQSSDFIGLPVPMAAGAVVSTMYLVVYTYETDRILNTGWQIVMALAMAGVSILMMSRVIYPSFKHITFKKKTTATAIVGAVIAICALVAFPWVMPAVLFCLYLLYGLLMRPWLTRRWQARIEAMDDEDEES
ncbi:CDP-diacylglycerol--serine O-phosphatidyltransferase [Akkermansia glycaniphila]|uniref:CDP-diacylglycerol--serine O-phosphatidyltransferase n=1 Tax=Akkermansia glycaniphila TaxID=1679444 RepID=A0A1C7PDX9_9BACT|nr:CDP-diacylglycerol--serine O-phosphatidyltransferase [Akkermansia glycaniphila]OCA03806.1 CDP-diacylglycerol O-phosphatidyltransferase [Akkermansia glycaniphila]SEH81801.1 pssa: cdp-diacylglycerol-serine o-phosphatidyltransferase [Akkermansia glycaniphila]